MIQRDAGDGTYLGYDEPEPVVAPVCWCNTPLYPAQGVCPVCVAARRQQEATAASAASKSPGSPSPSAPEAPQG